MSDATDPGSDLIGPVELAAALTGDRPPVVLDVRWTFAGGPDPDAYLPHTSRARSSSTWIATWPAHPAAGVVIRCRTPARCSRPGAGRVSTPGTWSSPTTSTTARARCARGGCCAGAASTRGCWTVAWPAGMASWRPGRTPGSTRTVPVATGGMPTVELDAAADLAVEPSGVPPDARAPERYRGEVEPVDPIAGHIPGAINVPFAQFYGPDGRLRPEPELRRCSRAGVTADPAGAASCGSGVTACHLVLAGRIAGIERRCTRARTPGGVRTVDRCRRPLRRRDRARLSRCPRPSRCPRIPPLPQPPPLRRGRASLGNGAPLVIWDPAMLGYDLGGSHPLHPLRWQLTWELAQRLGVLAGIDRFAPDPASRRAAGHRPHAGYIAAVKAASGPGRTAQRHAPGARTGQRRQPEFRAHARQRRADRGRVDRRGPRDRRW